MCPKKHKYQFSFLISPRYMPDTSKLYSLFIILGLSFWTFTNVLLIAFQQAVVIKAKFNHLSIFIFHIPEDRLKYTETQYPYVCNLTDGHLFQFCWKLQSLQRQLIWDFSVLKCTLFIWEFLQGKVKHYMYYCVFEI